MGSPAGRLPIATRIASERGIGLNSPVALIDKVIMKGDNNMNIQINPTFKSLIPALSAEEYTQLEQNIVKDGCREPLILWGDVLIDGHNRYEICTNNEIDFKTVQKEFSNENEAINWMIDNQLGRRNISPQQRDYLIGKRYKGEKKQGERTDLTLAHNEPKSSTADTIAKQNNVSRETVKRAEKFADGVDKIATVNPELKETILSGSSDFTKKEIIEIAKAPVEKIPEIIEAKKPHVTNNSGNNEWYTPKEYVEIARKSMGSIDCDPASSEVANKTVQSEVFYTCDDDGLQKDWNGNVWMNPPYSTDLINQFSEKLINQIEQGNTKQACVLVNNATETKWFQLMAEKAQAIWFIKSRIKFLNASGIPQNTPLQGQCILYFGDNIDSFTKHCDGLVYRNCL